MTPIKGIPMTRIPDDAREHMIVMYGDGHSIRTIAGYHQRSYGSVHRTLKQRGVEFRPRGGNNRGR